jgi:hypothetical protein
MEKVAAIWRSVRICLAGVCLYVHSLLQMLSWSSQTQIRQPRYSLQGRVRKHERIRKTYAKQEGAHEKREEAEIEAWEIMQNLM